MNNTTIVHANILKPSTPDEIALGACVEERFIDLTGSYQRIKHERLPIPVDLFPDMKKWRAMRRRHKAGDYRNTEAEFVATKMIASWTYTLNCEIRNQVRMKLVWE